MKPTAQAVRQRHKPERSPGRGERNVTSEMYRSSYATLFFFKNATYSSWNECFWWCSSCRDIFRDRRDARLAHAEHSIPCLPRECAIPFLARPTRRIRLHHPRNLRRGVNRPHPYQNMNVIAAAVDDQSRPVHLAHDASEVSEEIVPKFRLDQRTSSLRRTDHVQQDISRCMRHALSPLRAWVPISALTHGLRRGLLSSAASRLRARHFKLSPLNGCAGCDDGAMLPTASLWALQSLGGAWPFRTSTLPVANHFDSLDDAGGESVIDITKSPRPFKSGILWTALLSRLGPVLENGDDSSPEAAKP